MDSQLLSLPFELRTKVYRRCRSKELASLSLCCKWCYDDVLPVLWNDVTVSWTYLESSTFDRHQFRNLELTTRLQFDEFDVESTGGKVGAFMCVKLGFLIHQCDPKRLKSLSFKGRYVPDCIRTASGIFPDLDTFCLELVEDRIPEADCEYFACFRGLKSLSLERCDMNGRQWSKICLMETLETLEYTYSSLNPSSVIDFKLTHLRKLKMSCANIQDEFLLTVGKSCTHLEFLDISYSDSRISDVGIFYISHLLSLKYLDLAYSGDLTNSGLSFLSKLSSLEYLNLNSCCEHVTNEGFRHLSKLTMLKELSMDTGNITDEGFLGALFLGALASKTLVSFI